MTLTARGAPALTGAPLGRAAEAAVTPILIHLSRAAAQNHPAGMAVALAALQTAVLAQPLDRIDLMGLLALARLGLHDLHDRGWGVLLVPLSLRLWLSVRVAVVDPTTHELAVSLVPRDQPHTATRLAQQIVDHTEEALCAVAS